MSPTPHTLPQHTSPQHFDVQPTSFLDAIFQEFNTWTHKDLYLLFLITLFGTALRLFHIDEKSLGIDEFFTVAHAFGNIIGLDTLNQLGHPFDPNTPQALAFYQQKLLTSHGLFNWQATTDVLQFNNHPPLYFWLMNMVLHTWEVTATALRTPSVIFNVLSIPMFYLLGKRLHSPTLGLIAASIFACSGYQVFHSQNARPYTMVTFLAITQAWFLLRATTWAVIKDSPNVTDTWRIRPATEKLALLDWLGFTALSITGILTHYFYIPFLLGLSVWGLLTFRKAPHILVPFISSFMIAGLALIPGFHYVQAQMGWMKQAGHFTQHANWGWIQLPEIIWRVLNTQLAPKNALLPIANIALILYNLSVFYWLQNHARKVSPLVTFALIWIVAIILFQIGFDLLNDTNSLTIKRYTLLAAPGFYLILACALLNIKTREITPVFIGCAIFSACLLFNTYQIINQHTYVSSDFQRAARWIDTQIKPHDTFWINRSGPSTIAMAHYLPQHTSKETAQTLRLWGFPLKHVITAKQGKQFKRHLTQLTQNNQRFWVVSSKSNATIKLAIETHIGTTDYYLKTSKTFKGNLSVFLYEPTQNNRTTTQ